MAFSQSGSPVGRPAFSCLLTGGVYLLTFLHGVVVGRDGGCFCWVGCGGRLLYALPDVNVKHLDVDTSCRQWMIIGLEQLDVSCAEVVLASHIDLSIIHAVERFIPPRLIICVKRFKYMYCFFFNFWMFYFFNIYKIVIHWRHKMMQIILFSLCACNYILLSCSMACTQ